MARKLEVGIRKNSIQTFISGARVAFDPRTTEEVSRSVDPTNYKAQEKLWRTLAWEARQAEERAKRNAA